MQLNDESILKVNEMLSAGKSGIVLIMEDGSQTVLDTGSSSGEALRKAGFTRTSLVKEVFSFISIHPETFAKFGKYWQDSYTWEEYLVNLRILYSL